MGLSISMAVNKRGSGRMQILAILNEFVTIGYITRLGTRYRITELGKDQLILIDYTLRRAMIKVLKSDPLTRNLPGPKKGQPMPNRWPEGQPKGRKPRSEGGK